MAMEQTAGGFATYEDQPYYSLPVPHSHPANLAMVAALLGLTPPPVAGCRVLELGSGTGPNLLPMAADLPGAELLGIDLSPRQVAMSNEAAAALGLRNVTFRVMDILDVTPELGRFDYILAHGIFSWVPPVVRDKVLEICRDNLTEQGVACISYNTLPGWNITNVLRDFMMFHVRGEATAEERARRGGEALELLASAKTDKGEPTTIFMRAYAAQYQRLLADLGPNRESSLNHDILAEINQPFYFRDFAAQVERHGLQYLTEAPFRLSVPADLPREVKDRILESVGSVVDLEQYMDFVLMRTFRQSVLCRADREVSRTLEPGRLKDLVARTILRPESSRPDVASVTVEKFLGPDGTSVATNHPVSKAALCLLAERSPASLPVTALLQAARERLGQERQPGDEDLSSADGQELARILLKAFAGRRDIVTLRAHGPELQWAPSERPVCRPLARIQARTQPMVTNCYHEALHLDPVQRAIVPLLDGTRDRVAVLGELVRLAEEGQLSAERNGRPIQEADQLRIVLGRDLDLALERLGQRALLIA